MMIPEERARKVEPNGDRRAGCRPALAESVIAKPEHIVHNVTLKREEMLGSVRRVLAPYIGSVWAYNEN